MSDQIIVPLDVPNTAAAIALLALLPEVSFWKVGLQLFVSEGPQILTLLQERKKKIFLDLKFHDIPNTVAQACISAQKYQVELLTLHASAGRNALKKAVEAIEPLHPKPKLLAISLLTSINSRELALDLKIPLEVEEYALTMALMAKESGIDGAVCSPLEVAQMRRICGDDFLIVCPGVRPPWSENQDQQRVMTPKEAIKAGANYLVIGRPITQAQNPHQAWELICEELA